MKGGPWLPYEWEDLVRGCKEWGLSSFSDVAGLVRIEIAYCKLLDPQDNSHCYRPYTATRRK